ncbi:MAG: hypothetical protein K0R85_531 [Devosia sp.]|jgi:hypothetical protein|nr:hypothetical protein [Devosia sp.]
MEGFVNNSVGNPSAPARHMAPAPMLEFYDEKAHYSDVLKALSPAFFLLTVAATLMLAIL